METSSTVTASTTILFNGLSICARRATRNTPQKRLSIPFRIHGTSPTYTVAICQEKDRVIVLRDAERGHEIRWSLNSGYPVPPETTLLGDELTSAFHPEPTFARSACRRSAERSAFTPSSAALLNDAAASAAH